MALLLNDKAQLLVHRTAHSAAHLDVVIKHQHACAVSGMSPVHYVRDVTGPYPLPISLPPVSANSLFSVVWPWDSPQVYRPSGVIRRIQITNRLRIPRKVLAAYSREIEVACNDCALLRDILCKTRWNEEQQKAPSRWGLFNYLATIFYCASRGCSVSLAVSTTNATQSVSAANRCATCIHNGANKITSSRPSV